MTVVQRPITEWANAPTAKVEEVARAMFEACEAEVHRTFPGRLRKVTWEERKAEMLSDPRHGDPYTAALSALDAMREPTEEMKAACMAPRIGSPLESYTAMIDAALGIPNPRNDP